MVGNSPLWTTPIFGAYYMTMVQLKGWTWWSWSKMPRKPSFFQKKYISWQRNTCSSGINTNFFNGNGLFHSFWRSFHGLVVERHLRSWNGPTNIIRNVKKTWKSPSLLFFIPFFYYLFQNLYDPRISCLFMSQFSSKQEVLVDSRSDGCGNVSLFAWRH